MPQAGLIQFFTFLFLSPSCGFIRREGEIFSKITALMMRISTAGRYSLRLMVHLASRPDGKPVALRTVSEQQHIPLKYLESIVSVLVREGLMTSLRGKMGGYCLSRPPENYTVYEILRVAEGDLAPVACLSRDASPCPMEQECATRPVWEGLNQVIREYLEGITLDRIAREPRGQFSFCDGI